MGDAHTYTDEDLALADQRGRDVAANLDALMSSESALFREARRAAVEAQSWTRWNGAGEYEQMSAALHAALRVLGVEAT